MSLVQALHTAVKKQVTSSGKPLPRNPEGITATKSALTKNLFVHDSFQQSTNKPTWKTLRSGPLVRLSTDSAQGIIPRFYKIDESYFRGAQPGIKGHDDLSDADLHKAIAYLHKEHGIRTILNLRNATDLHPENAHRPSNHQEREGKAIQALNATLPPHQHIRYINIPIDSGEAITNEQIRPILDILHAASPKNRLYVHCKAGIDRTGLVTLLYRAIKSPSTPIQTLHQEMRDCGHNIQGYWKGYIDNAIHHLSSQPELEPYYFRHIQSYQNSLPVESG